MPTHLPTERHISALVAAGTALRRAAEAAGPTAPVPTCPTWDVTALVTHQGMVHRWANAHLTGADADRPARFRAEAEAAPDLLGWFEDGLHSLADTLRTTSDTTRAMVFLDDAPPPRRFWARRQAHETTIHSLDALSAVLGRTPTTDDLTVPPDVAADGIDELLCGFITRGRGKLAVDRPLRILVRTTDTAHAWVVDAAPGSVTTTTGPPTGPTDARIVGPAAELYAALWNRVDALPLEGPVGLAGQWREQVRIRWGGG